MIEFFAGVYVGGMITETVLSVYAKEPKLQVVRSALIWPFSTAVAIVRIAKR